MHVKRASVLCYPLHSHSLPASVHLSGCASRKILFTSSRGTVVGVCCFPGSVWVFSDDPAGCVGVEAVEELLKATGVCVTVRTRAAKAEYERSTEESPLSG